MRRESQNRILLRVSFSSMVTVCNWTLILRTGPKECRMSLMYLSAVRCNAYSSFLASWWGLSRNTKMLELQFWCCGHTPIIAVLVSVLRLPGVGMYVYVHFTDVRFKSESE